MEDKKLLKISLAHLKNEFATKAKLNFSSVREWQVFLYLVAQLDPQNEEELLESIISVKDIKKFFEKDGKRSGSFYNELTQCTERMIGLKCVFDTAIKINGNVLPEYRNIFGTISPFKSKGTIFLKYQFTNSMKPLLLGFKKNFMGIEPPTNIKNRHAIRFLILAKSERDSKRKHEKISILKYDINKFKGLLGIEDKYPRYNNFRQWVIEPLIEGVNQSEIVYISKYETTRKGRSIKDLIFHVEDDPNYTVSEPVPMVLSSPKDNGIKAEQLETLTRAQQRAYEFLLEKSIYSGIAFTQIIPRMPSSVCDGYEDYFCEEAYKIVLEKATASTTEAKAGVFVKWFQKDIFKTDQFSRIIEAVHQRKNELSLDARANREYGKSMTNTEFKKNYKEQEKSVSSDMEELSKQFDINKK